LRLAKAVAKGGAALLAFVFAGLAARAQVAPVGQGTFPQALADSGYHLRVWGTEHGLPENSATAIVQTPDGYLWFGTFNGLVRFNGDQFKVFHPGNTPSLPSVVMVNLHADTRGRLWVSTDAGLVVKDGSQWRSLGADEGWVGNHVRTFTEGRNGEVLITTFDGHVLVVEKDQLTALPPPPGEPGQGYLGTVDDHGKWWLAQRRFVGFWDGHRWVQVHDPDPSVGRSTVACATAQGGGIWVLLGKELLRFREDSEVSRRSVPRLRGGIWSLLEDRQANLWISSYDSGLYQFTPGGELRHWTSTNGLGTRFVRGVFEDREENLWVGSSGDGLRRLTRQRFHRVDGVNQPLPARGISPAREGGLWVAYFDAGLFRVNHGVSVRAYESGTNSPSVYGLSVLEDRAGRLWYGEQDGCWWRRPPGAFEKVPLPQSAGANVRALFEDSQGRIWIGTRSGAVVYDGQAFRPLGPETGLPPSDIVGFGEDGSRVLWVAGAEGVFRQDQGAFRAVRHPGGQPMLGVLFLKSDAEGSMWMGTRKDGLIRWRNGTVDRVGVPHGLPDLQWRGLLEDEEGYYWISSNRGIIRISRKQLHLAADGSLPRMDFQLLDQHDGLLSPECSIAQPASMRDTTGRLWFATQKGVFALDPAEFRLNSHPPPVQIEEVTYRLPATQVGANSERLSTSYQPLEVRLTTPMPAQLRLPPGFHDLEVGFAALTFNAPEKVRFQYRFDGTGPDWKDAGYDRFIRFHLLPPGEYIFRVRAANNDGVWNEAGTSLAFSVQPFFWQTGWFRFGTGLLLVGSGGGLAWAWARQRIALALERERLAHETQDLRDELAHASRVSTLGQLASGLAHELGQPLGAILRNAETAEILMAEPSPDLEEIRAILTDIRQDDHRAAGVIDRMRALLQRGNVERTPLSVEDLVREVAALTRYNLAQGSIQLALEVPPGLPLVGGDRVQLQQVLLNLFINAIAAMSQQPAESRWLKARARLTDRHLIQVSVLDSGPGIPHQSLARVFEPFYSTKPEGMGMGLAVSKTIIEAHQGKIWAENRPDGGACFSFTVPTWGG
jgi:signal transduction histidine kinase/ligand-binding sensor domain-containing protein